MVSQKPIRGEASITPPQIRKVSLTPAALATRPQPQLPSATPPAMAAWKAASARPATQRGAESCTPMLNSAIASIQAAPAITSISAVSTGQRLSAMPMMATPMMNVQMRTENSASNLRRTVETLSAPITAPRPNAPSMMP